MSITSSKKLEQKFILSLNCMLIMFGIIEKGSEDGTSAENKVIEGDCTLRKTCLK